jgi:rhamnose transport system permease protein
MNATAPRAQIVDKEAFRWSTLFLRWEFILAVLLLGVMVMGTVISPYFLDIWTLSDATFNFSEKAIIALPMALLILTREIDLSVAAIIALASLAMGLCAGLGYGPWALAFVGITVGCLCLLSSSPSAPCRCFAGWRRSSWATRPSQLTPQAFRL